MEKKNVVFVCESNSCRSQMAEGWARTLHGETINAFSGGIQANPLDKRAVQVMEEVGVDISIQETHRVQDFLEKEIDVVITVCTEAAKYCPKFSPEVKIINKYFDNPPEVVKEVESEEEKLQVYRRVRDEIKQLVEELPSLIEG